MSKIEKCEFCGLNVPVIHGVPIGKRYLAAAQCPCGIVMRIKNRFPAKAAAKEAIRLSWNWHMSKLKKDGGPNDA